MKAVLICKMILVWNNKLVNSKFTPPPPIGTKEMRLGIHDILVNSSIVDERALVKSKPLLVDNRSIPIGNKIIIFKVLNVEWRVKIRTSFYTFANG